MTARIGIRAIATAGNKKPLHRVARGFVFPARIRHARVPGNDMPANLARINLLSCDRHIDLLGMNGWKKRVASFNPDGMGVKTGFVFLTTQSRQVLQDNNSRHVKGYRERIYRPLGTVR
jgi:hypothetical protein